MMAGRIRKEGELIGNGGKRRGVRRVSRSKLKLRFRGVKGIGVLGIQRVKDSVPGMVIVDDAKDTVADGGKQVVGLGKGEELSDRDFVQV